MDLCFVNRYKALNAITENFMDNITQGDGLATLSFSGQNYGAGKTYFGEHLGRNLPRNLKLSLVKDYRFSSTFPDILNFLVAENISIDLRGLSSKQESIEDALSELIWKTMIGHQSCGLSLEDKKKKRRDFKDSGLNLIEVFPIMKRVVALLLLCV